VWQTAGILLLVSALAVTVPIVRALRTNPVTVLRVE
jgi:ABC-type lipoprotein release transport system permease subunit